MKQLSNNFVEQDLVLFLRFLIIFFLKKQITLNLLILLTIIVTNLIKKLQYSIHFSHFI